MHNAGNQPTKSPPMAVLTIKNLPSRTYEALRARATGNRRSIVAEARVILEQAVDCRTVSEDELLARLEAMRQSSRVVLDDESLRSAIDEGRP